MQKHPSLKLFFSVLPVILLTACSSSSEDNAQTQAAAETGQSSSASSQVSGVEQATLQQLQLNNRVLFGFDQSALTPEAKSVLEQHVQFLKAHPSISVTIEGHTDATGTPEYNIALGERRATALKMYLLSKGVSASQISTVSYGEEKPIALGKDPGSQAKNRRAVIVYY